MAELNSDYPVGIPSGRTIGPARVVDHDDRADTPPRSASLFLPPNATPIGWILLLLIALGALAYGLSEIITSYSAQLRDFERLGDGFWRAISVPGAIAVAGLVVAAICIRKLTLQPERRAAYLVLQRGNLGEPRHGTVTGFNIDYGENGAARYQLGVDVDGEHLKFSEPRSVEVRIDQADLPKSGDPVWVWPLTQRTMIAQLEPRSRRRASS